MIYTKRLHEHDYKLKSVIIMNYPFEKLQFAAPQMKVKCAYHLTLVCSYFTAFSHTGLKKHIPIHYVKNNYKRKNNHTLKKYTRFLKVGFLNKQQNLKNCF